jgi:transcriptional regulator with XRE-family HTH domain
MRLSNWPKRTWVSICMSASTDGSLPCTAMRSADRRAKGRAVTTMEYPQKLWKYDLPHIGALCRRIRESRGVRPADIARACEVAEATISRNLEENGKTGFKTFTRYVAALQSDLAQPPLIAQQARMLRSLYRHSQEKEVRERQCALSALSLEHITPRRHPTELSSMVAALQQEERPALVMDSLWFIHALNGALLRLFTINPSDPFLQGWDGWHVMASKCRATSPVRLAHLNTDEFLPPMIALLLSDEHTYPYLFTLQMRVLLQRLHELSEQQGLEFSVWWLHAISFNLPYKLQVQTRTLIYHGEPIQVEVTSRLRQAVELEEGYIVPYTLVVWNPIGSDAQRAFDDIRSGVESKQIFFAADYDTKHDFYVNEWPRVADEIEQWGCL